MEFIDISKLKIIYHENQVLDVLYDNKEYHFVKCVLCFPLTMKDKYVSLISGEEKPEEIGIIEDINQLDNDSKIAIMKDIEIRYLMPEILKITKRKYHHRFYTFTCITSSGEKSIRVNDLVYNLFKGNNGDLYLKDVDENYYIIRDYENKNDKQIKFIRSFI